LLALALEPESLDGVDAVAEGALAGVSALVEASLAPESPLALADAAGASEELFSLGCARVSVE
jgi:hypothetical protein